MVGADEATRNQYPFMVNLFSNTVEVKYIM